MTVQNTISNTDRYLIAKWIAEKYNVRIASGEFFRLTPKNASEMLKAKYGIKVSPEEIDAARKRDTEG